MDRGRTPGFCSKLWWGVWTNGLEQGDWQAGLLCSMPTTAVDSLCDLGQVTHLCASVFPFVEWLWTLQGDVRHRGGRAGWL